MPQSLRFANIGRPGLWSQCPPRLPKPVQKLQMKSTKSFALRRPNLFMRLASGTRSSPKLQMKKFASSLRALRDSSLRSGAPIQHVGKPAMEPAFSGRVIALAFDVFVSDVRIVPAEPGDFLFDTKLRVFGKHCVATLPKFAMLFNDP